MYLHMHPALVTIANAQLSSPLLKELPCQLLVLEGDLRMRAGGWKKKEGERGESGGGGG